MTDPISVEIKDPSHAATLNRWIGQIEALNALETKAKDFDKLPGFGLALAILNAVTADTRAAAVADNLRAVAKAGIDVSATRSISLEPGQKGRITLKVEMMDLADLAGGA